MESDMHGRYVYFSDLNTFSVIGTSLFEMLSHIVVNLIHFLVFISFPKGIAKLPFIDEDRLLAEVKKIENTLTVWQLNRVIESCVSVEWVVFWVKCF